jgi:hypothetical protein
MTQQFLDGAQVGAFRQHVGAEGVAQSMRMHVGRKPFSNRDLLYDASDATAGQRTTSAVDKKLACDPAAGVEQ